MDNYGELEWAAALGEGFTVLVLLLAVARVLSAKYSRHESKNMLTLLPLKACLVLVLLLMGLMFMNLVCSDHTKFENRINLLHELKRFFETFVICLGCFVTAIQALEWSLLECMIVFQTDSVTFNELVVRRDEYRQKEKKRIRVF